MQSSICSKNLNVYTIEQKKIAVSGEDNKRFVCQDNIHTLAWGHYKLNNINIIYNDKKLKRLIIE